MVHCSVPDWKKCVTAARALIRIATGTVLCVVILAGCAARSDPSAAVEDLFAPESPAAAADFAARLRPEAQGLRSWQDIAPGLQSSLAYVSSKNPDEVALADGDVTITWDELSRTIQRLQALLPRLDAEPQLLATEFRWLRLSGKAHFSGYYVAEIPASRTRKPGFTYPLYKTPPDLAVARLGDFDPVLGGMRLVHRLDSGNNVVPYYSREDIDIDGALRGKNLELAWIADPLDAFFLHVQGSGRLRYQDGTVEQVLYDADNGRPYTSVGQVLAGLGFIDPAGMSMQSIRDWVHKNPMLSDKILNRNKRYVFFRLASSGPVGSMGRKLTPMVSLAVDRTTFPLGSVLLFSTPFPEENPGGQVVHSRKLDGIGLAQDTGGAVKLRRVDIFCGSGERAVLEAGHLNARGDAWLLVPR